MSLNFIEPCIGFKVLLTFHYLYNSVLNLLKSVAAWHLWEIHFPQNNNIENLKCKNYDNSRIIFYIHHSEEGLTESPSLCLLLNSDLVAPLILM